MQEIWHKKHFMFDYNLPQAPNQTLDVLGNRSDWISVAPGQPEEHTLSKNLIENFKRSDFDRLIRPSAKFRSSNLK